MMKLLIDIGNQRLKWLTKDTWGTIYDRGIINHQTDSFEVKMKTQFGNLSKPSSVWIINTFKKDMIDKVARFAQDKWAMSPNYIQSVRQIAGVTNSYSLPLQLGTDRWAAIIAARKLVKPIIGVIVIDAGTAVTVDYVDSKGFFKGGVIIPGIETMKKALNAQIEKITISVVTHNKRQSINMLNIDTQSAVVNGANLAVVSAIDSGILRLKKITGENVKVLITGGDARRVIEMSDHQLCLEDDLVLQGIDIIAQEYLNV